MKKTTPKGARNDGKQRLLKPELSGRKRRVFQLMLFMLPVAFFALLELSLRIAHYGGITDLFVSTPDENSPYYGINRNVGRRYFFQTGFIPTPRKDLFLKQKPTSCYRIFVLGESTTASFPYGNNLMFSRILHRRLMDTFPDRRIEVVNTAFTAINSYTLLDFMDEILAQQPDALLIYTGHNEFYGALGIGSVESLGRYRWMTKTYLALQKLKTIVLVRNIVRAVAGGLGSSPNLEAQGDPTATTMARIVRDKVIPLDSPLYRSGKTQFSENLREILAKARKAHVPVLLSELVSNTRDQAPFISVQHDTLAPAMEVFQRAQMLEKEGRMEEARRAYYRAKDLDALRFRATEEFNGIIHSLAKEFGAAVIPLESIFENASPHGLIGHGLILEHLHPNLDGYFLMGEAFYSAMRREGLISQVWDERNIRPAASYRQHWGYTVIDSVYAELSVVQLKGGWPFKQTAGPNLALDRYSARTKADSLVLRILRRGEMTLEQGHIELAEYYRRRGELEKAFAEYQALIYTVPYLDLFYEPALELLVEMKAYERAYALANDLRRFEESAFVHQWLGQIAAARKNSMAETNESVSDYILRAQADLKARRIDEARVLLNQSLQIEETALAHELLGEISLVQKKPEEALKHLQTARKMKASDEPKLLYNLAIAHYLTSDYEKAWETFLQLKKIYPNFSDPGKVEVQIKRALGNQ